MFSAWSRLYKECLWRTSGTSVVISCKSAVSEEKIFYFLFIRKRKNGTWKMLLIVSIRNEKILWKTSPTLFVSIKLFRLVVSEILFKVSVNQKQELPKWRPCYFCDKTKWRYFVEDLKNAFLAKIRSNVPKFRIRCEILTTTDGLKVMPIIKLTLCHFHNCILYKLDL